MAYESDEEAGLRAGAAAYVIKPDIESLMTVIDELLRDNGPVATGGAQS